MAYTSHFTSADDMINHLSSIVSATNDSFMSSRYVGFVAVSAVTVYELALKEIFIEFAQKKNKVFGIYVKSHFDRINGRIRINQIKDDYIKKFGQKYLLRYNKKVGEIEKQILSTQRRSLLSSYENLITWRNEFAHDGHIPSNVTFNDVVSSYHLGKELIKCIYLVMNR